jgi:hypothetical protein
MADDAVRKEAEEGQEQARSVTRKAQEVEGLAQVWLDRAMANPPKTNPEREEFRARAAEFRRIASDRLADTSQALMVASTLTKKLDEWELDDQALVLRIQLAPILEAEAATARAIALVLDTCRAMEAASKS